MNIIVSLLILLGFVVGIVLFFLWLGGLSPWLLATELWWALSSWIRDRLRGARP